MPESRRHKRFQIHLSTAVVMMFVAAGIMWLNVIPKQELLSGVRWQVGIYVSEPVYKNTRGWPCDIYFWYKAPESVKAVDAPVSLVDLNGDRLMFPNGIYEFGQRTSAGWIINSLAGIAVVSIIAWVLERRSLSFDNDGEIAMGISAGMK